MFEWAYLVLRDPSFWAVLGTLVGVLATTLANALGRRREWQLAALEATVARLDDEVTRLVDRVSALEAERNLLARKLRVALDWARKLLSWGDGVADLVDPTVDVPVSPTLPEFLESDY